MANKDATLQQGEEQIYPRTFTRNVYENDGKTPLDITLAKLQQQINNNVVVDKELSSTSENPVSNKTVTDKLDELQTYFTEEDNNIQENFNTQIQDIYDTINSLSGSIDGLLVEVNNNINNLENTKQNKLNFSEDFIVDENNNVSLNINIPNITIDSELSSESENAVQNKIITKALEKLVDVENNQLISGQKDFTTSPRVAVPVSILPEGYTQLTHIDSIGGQYIDLGYKLSYATRNELVFEPLELTGVQQVIIGTYDKYNAQKIVYPVLITTSGEIQSRIISNYLANNTIAVVGTKYHIVSNVTTISQDLYINDTLVGQSNSNLELADSLFLFALNDHNTNTAKNHARIRLYSYKAYNSNNTLVRDFIPCYRNSDEKAGLYDLVNNQFFGNNGEGDFVKGYVTTGTEYVPLASQTDLDNFYNKTEIDDLINSISTGDSSSGESGLELLWTNPSPTAKFPAQSVTLKENTYDFYLIYTKFYYSSATGSFAGVIAPFKHYSCGMLGMGATGGTSGDRVYVNRSVRMPTHTQFDFQSCVVNAGAQTTVSVSDNYMVPLEIYGIKLGVNSNDYQKHFQAFGALKSESTHYGFIAYDRTDKKSGLLTISFKCDTNDSSDFAMCSLSRINTLLGLNLKNPDSKYNSGIWTATSGYNGANQGYGGTCELTTSGNINISRFYTTDGAIGGLPCSVFNGQVVNIYNLYVEEE